MAEDGAGRAPKVRRFGQRPESLARRIQRITAQYDGAMTPFKELLQNADDARAESALFCLDLRSFKENASVVEHWRNFVNSDTEVTTKDIHPGAATSNFLGPSILAYNSAQLTAKDWTGLMRIGVGGKAGDADSGAKTGRFGLGFNSTYIFTDTPTILSGNELRIFDPLARALPVWDDQDNRGMGLDIPDNPMADLFRINLALPDTKPAVQIPSPEWRPTASPDPTPAKQFCSGTLFRFPLRLGPVPDPSPHPHCKEHNSARTPDEFCRACSHHFPLCSKHHTEPELLGTIHELAASLHTLPLFLKNINHITVAVWRPGQPQPTILALYDRNSTLLRIDRPLPLQPGVIPVLVTTTVADLSTPSSSTTTRCTYIRCSLDPEQPTAILKSVFETHETHRGTETIGHLELRASAMLLLCRERLPTAGDDPDLMPEPLPLGPPNDGKIFVLLPVTSSATPCIPVHIDASLIVDEARTSLSNPHLKGDAIRVIEQALNSPANPLRPTDVFGSWNAWLMALAVAPVYSYLIAYVTRHHLSNASLQPLVTSSPASPFPLPIDFNPYAIWPSKADATSPLLALVQHFVLRALQKEALFLAADNNTRVCLDAMLMVDPCADPDLPLGSDLWRAVQNLVGAARPAAALGLQRHGPSLLHPESILHMPHFKKYVGKSLTLADAIALFKGISTTVTVRAADYIRAMPTILSSLSSVPWRLILPADDPLSRGDPDPRLRLLHSPSALALPLFHPTQHQDSWTPSWFKAWHQLSSALHTMAASPTTTPFSAYLLLTGDNGELPALATKILKCITDNIQDLSVPASCLEATDVRSLLLDSAEPSACTRDAAWHYFSELAVQHGISAADFDAWRPLVFLPLPSGSHVPIGGPFVSTEQLDTLSIPAKQLLLSDLAITEVPPALRELAARLESLSSSSLLPHFADFNSLVSRLCRLSLGQLADCLAAATSLDARPLLPFVQSLARTPGANTDAALAHRGLRSARLWRAFLAPHGPAPWGRLIDISSDLTVPPPIMDALAKLPSLAACVLPEPASEGGELWKSIAKASCPSYATPLTLSGLYLDQYVEIINSLLLLHGVDGLLQYLDHLAENWQTALQSPQLLATITSNIPNAAAPPKLVAANTLQDRSAPMISLLLAHADKLPPDVLPQPEELAHPDLSGATLDLIASNSSNCLKTMLFPEQALALITSFASGNADDGPLAISITTDADVFEKVLDMVLDEQVAATQHRHPDSTLAPFSDPSSIPILCRRHGTADALFLIPYADTLPDNFMPRNDEEERMLHGRFIVEEHRNVKLRRLLFPKPRSAVQMLFNKLGGSFGQQADLVENIQDRILRETTPAVLPFELVQNAEDARASSIQFWLDPEGIPGPASAPSAGSATGGPPPELLEAFLGPALFVFNDSTFAEDDFQSIQQLGRSRKAKDTATIGKYGLGFNTVYHITDTPMFVSAGRICIFEPARTWLESAGLSLAIEQAQNHLPWMVRCFEACPQWKTLLASGRGTIFRLPFHKGRPQIAAQAANADSVREVLRTFAVGGNETAPGAAASMADSLIFLRSVQSVSVSLHPTAKDATFQLHAERQLDGPESPTSVRTVALHREVEPTSVPIATYRIARVELESRSANPAADGQPTPGPAANRNPVLWLEAAAALSRAAMDSVIAASCPNPTDPIPIPTPNPSGRLFCHLPTPVRLQTLAIKLNGPFQLMESRSALAMKPDQSGLAWPNQELLDRLTPDAIIVLLKKAAPEERLPLVCSLSWTSTHDSARTVEGRVVFPEMKMLEAVYSRLASEQIEFLPMRGQIVSPEKVAAATHRSTLWVKEKNGKDDPTLRVKEKNGKDDPISNADELRQLSSRLQADNLPLVMIDRAALHKLGLSVNRLLAACNIEDLDAGSLSTLLWDLHCDDQAPAVHSLATGDATLSLLNIVLNGTTIHAPFKAFSMPSVLFVPLVKVDAESGDDGDSLFQAAVALRPFAIQTVEQTNGVLPPLQQCKLPSLDEVLKSAGAKGDIRLLVHARSGTPPLLQLPSLPPAPASPGTLRLVYPSSSCSNAFALVRQTCRMVPAAAAQTVFMHSDALELVNSDLLPDNAHDHAVALLLEHAEALLEPLSVLRDETIPFASADSKGEDSKAAGRARDWAKALWACNLPWDDAIFVKAMSKLPVLPTQLGWLPIGQASSVLAQKNQASSTLERLHIPVWQETAMRITPPGNLPQLDGTFTAVLHQLCGPLAESLGNLLCDDPAAMSCLLDEYVWPEISKLKRTSPSTLNHHLDMLLGLPIFHNFFSGELQTMGHIIESGHRRHYPFTCLHADSAVGQAIWRDFCKGDSTQQTEAARVKLCQLAGTHFIVQPTEGARKELMDLLWLRQMERSVAQDSTRMSSEPPNAQTFAQWFRAQVESHNVANKNARKTETGRQKKRAAESEPELIPMTALLTFARAVHRGYEEEASRLKRDGKDGKDSEPSVLQQCHAGIGKALEEWKVPGWNIPFRSYFGPSKALAAQPKEVRLLIQQLHNLATLLEQRKLCPQAVEALTSCGLGPAAEVQHVLEWLPSAMKFTDTVSLKHVQDAIQAIGDLAKTGQLTWAVWRQTFNFAFAFISWQMQTTQSKLQRDVRRKTKNCKEEERKALLGALKIAAELELKTVVESLLDFALVPARKIGSLSESIDQQMGTKFSADGFLPAVELVGLNRCLHPDEALLAGLARPVMARWILDEYIGVVATLRRNLLPAMDTIDDWLSTVVRSKLYSANAADVCKHVRTMMDERPDSWPPNVGFVDRQFSEALMHPTASRAIAGTLCDEIYDANSVRALQLVCAWVFAVKHLRREDGDGTQTLKAMEQLLIELWIPVRLTNEQVAQQHPCTQQSVVTFRVFGRMGAHNSDMDLFPIVCSPADLCRTLRATQPSGLVVDGKSVDDLLGELGADSSKEAARYLGMLPVGCEVVISALTYIRQASCTFDWREHHSHIVFALLQLYLKLLGERAKVSHQELPPELPLPVYDVAGQRQDRELLPRKDVYYFGQGSEELQMLDLRALRMSNVAVLFERNMKPEHADLLQLKKLSDMLAVVEGSAPKASMAEEVQLRARRLTVLLSERAIQVMLQRVFRSVCRKVRKHKVDTGTWWQESVRLSDDPFKACVVGVQQLLVQKKLRNVGTIVTRSDATQNFSTKWSEELVESGVEDGEQVHRAVLEICVAESVLMDNAYCSESLAQALWDAAGCSNGDEEVEDGEIRREVVQVLRIMLLRALLPLGEGKEDAAVLQMAEETLQRERVAELAELDDSDKEYCLTDMVASAQVLSESEETAAFLRRESKLQARQASGGDIGADDEWHALKQMGVVPAKRAAVAVLAQGQAMCTRQGKLELTVVESGAFMSRQRQGGRGAVGRPRMQRADMSMGCAEGPAGGSDEGGGDSSWTTQSAGVIAGAIDWEEVQFVQQKASLERQERALPAKQLQELANRPRRLQMQVHDQAVLNDDLRWLLEAAQRSEEREGGDGGGGGGGGGGGLDDNVGAGSGPAAGQDSVLNADGWARMAGCAKSSGRVTAAAGEVVAFSSLFAQPFLDAWVATAAEAGSRVSERQQQVGWLAEERVYGVLCDMLYGMLQKQYEEVEQVDVPDLSGCSFLVGGQEVGQVVWPNKGVPPTQDWMGPFDLLVRFNGRSMFYEVKGTQTDQAHFYWTPREVAFARAFPGRYRMIVVTGVVSAADMRLFLYNDPLAMLASGGFRPAAALHLIGNKSGAEVLEL